ncbi:lipocalin-like domain-containing protein [Aromatoleum bremense]|uniref:Carotenoid 1,2-hydratase n=1 Tax=Aromatoleum bremense TaxID=76115 RepID=A0ABX1NYD5_9RHOO|nr:lipocalin-like domain-containing protein [Aromatoleum bremense]NMG17064.1 carotenoid 1,2-hydratase [Aromatoleum bremense]QTQ33496.1 AttH-like domain superfamily protein [Aromatoleum bremense]
MRAYVAAALLWLASGLSAAPPAQSGSGSNNESDPPGYPPVVAGRPLQFPADHGAHPDYRTEWWYVTGWVTDEDGVERGFQVTFFRVRTRIGEDNPSRFAPRQLILAHAAVADPAEGRLLHAERGERALDPLAGAATGHTRAWVGEWALEWSQDHYRASVDADSFAYDLRFDPAGPPLPNGQDGFSQKAPDPRHASYYYSRPQLGVSGSLRVRGKTHRVAGHAWLDHEWSSAYLPEKARGWDWIGINLSDGGALMAFRMRTAAGEAMWTAGTLRRGNGAPRALAPGQVAFIPGRRWRSPRTGTEYPVEWQLDIDGRRLQLQPLMDDQELDSRRTTGTVYWEGAVRLLEDGREIGRGYLEMTGYGERLRM